MADLITLAKLKQYKGINSTNEDTKHNLLIAAASSYIKSYCGRTLIDHFSTPLEYETYSDGFNEFLFLYEIPIVEIDSVEYSVDAETWEPYTEYTIDRRLDLLRPSNGDYFPAGYFKTTYTGGYDPNAVPADLEMATVALIEHYRDKEYLPKKSVGGTTTEYVNYYDNKIIPKHIGRILSIYRVSY